MKLISKNFWKVVAVFFIAMISLGISSCSKDDDPKDNSIVGEWRLSVRESDDSFWYCQYKFKSNGTFEVKDWNSDNKEPSEYEASGTYTVTDSYLTLKFEDDDEQETYRYTLFGKKLTIYDYDEDGPNDFYKL